ncbi:uncharacterized protein LOC107800626 [Nicotiana tabacum]|uniref:Uncharacterized protein LOC107800626 n=1 Tax=Nicotiana tabacum TaxID=4097 RepID=A0A1S4ARW8_TOBAC|nr:PREDICTED: uncharacterized protein LOC107800626 [Nicotiana tabacum]
MEGYFNRIWKGKEIDKIAQVNRGVFVVRFTNVDDRENVVEEGVKMFDRKPIVVKPWKADCDVTKDKVYRIPIWIRLVGLDVKYWGKNSLTKITSLIGTPLKADKAMTNRDKMTYARVLVEIPLNQEYPTSVMFENEYGRIVEQKVEYEWKPVLCAKCKNFGHDIMNCRKQQREEIAKMGQGPGNQITRVKGIKAEQNAEQGKRKEWNGKQLPTPQKSRYEKGGTTTSNSFVSLNIAEAGESLEITRQDVQNSSRRGTCPGYGTSEGNLNPNGKDWILEYKGFK